MAHFTEDFRTEALSIARQYTDLSGFNDVEDVMNWIQLNRKSNIIDHIRDGAEWEEIVISELKPHQVIQADAGILRGNGKQPNVFHQITDEILYQYWCNTVIDLEYEVMQILANMDDEPEHEAELVISIRDTVRDMNDALNGKF